LREQKAILQGKKKLRERNKIIFLTQRESVVRKNRLTTCGGEKERQE